MSTAAIEQGQSVRTALPVCLFENSYMPVSLWDMLRVLTGDLCRASGIIGQMYAQVKSGVIPTDDSWGLVAGELGALERACQSLGLTSTLAQVLRIKPRLLSGDYRGDFATLARDIMEVHTRLIDDLQSRMFFVIQPDRVSYYDGVGRFGVEVGTAFPSAIYDLSESAKCYALSRNTACVFHLMRVLEIGLGPLARRFGVPYDHTNWETILNRVERAISEIDKDPKRPSNWKDDREFYSQCASYFYVVKDAWRNYTAHARGKYDEQEALDILVNIHGFMRRLN